VGAALCFVAVSVAAQAPQKYSVERKVKFEPGTPQVTQGLRKVEPVREIVSGGYMIAAEDLNDDKYPEIIVLASSPEFCGSAGCRMVVLRNTGPARFVEIGRHFASPNVGVLRETVNGYRLLATLDDQGAVALVDKTPLVHAMGTGAATETAQATAPASDASRRELLNVTVLRLSLGGIGELRFGERLQWRLVGEAPAEIRAGEGIRLGQVSIQSADGKRRYTLPEPAGYTHMEVGNSCELHRIAEYAVIRCMRDYVFNTQTGAAPIAITPQFRDRGDTATPWLLELPLPWWNPSGIMLSGSPVLFLEYGFVNYGQYIESTDIYRGPALLDLATGQIAIAHDDSTASAPVYDASAAGDNEPIALYPEAVVSDRTDGRGRTITVSTIFDRCVSARCRSADDPRFRQQRPLTYSFGR
jgi:hypothetical protein